MQRYAVAAELGFPVNLQFSEAETIKRSDFAFTAQDDKGRPAQAWKGPGKIDADGAKLEANRFKNNLPIWPFFPGHSSLVVVTVTADGQERPYQFDLMAYRRDTATTDAPELPLETKKRADEQRGIISGLSFTYPGDVKKAVDAQKAQQAQAWRVQQATASEAAGIARMKTDVFYGLQNKSYRWKGEYDKYAYLLPKSITDNGWLTQMQWPGNIQVPAVSIVNDRTGEELAVTPTVQNGLHVINTTAPHFRLRLGTKAVMDLINDGWKAERADPGTGTPSPDVVREIKYQAQATK
jgi:type IV secretory pathway VirB9-like protein